jgi:hypothetical protein
MNTKTSDRRKKRWLLFSDGQTLTKYSVTFPSGHVNISRPFDHTGKLLDITYIKYFKITA